MASFLVVVGRLSCMDLPWAGKEGVEEEPLADTKITLKLSYRDIDNMCGKRQCCRRLSPPIDVPSCEVRTASCHHQRMLQ